MKILFRNKTLAWLLVAYGLIQLSSMFLQSPVTLFAYELCYLTAIVIGTIRTIEKTKEEKDLIILGQTILLFLIINLGLLIVYIPTLLLNPSINWSLNDGTQSDPMILLVFWPLVHFLIALVILGFAGILTRLTISNQKK